MNIDQIFQQPFHLSAQNTHKQISSWTLKPIKRFPYTEFIVEGDIFFNKLWRMIDESKQYFWITTYAINSSPAADTTMLKMIEASKRGVHVVLFVDNVQFWVKHGLIKQFQNCGGKFLVLNPQFHLSSIKGYLNGDVWRRHHQKLIVSDSQGLIGSANIEGSYAGIRYGSYVYQDINYLTQNIALDQYRQHFIDTADLYDFNLDTKLQNNQLLQKYNLLFPNSEFYPTNKYKLLHNDPLFKKKQIEESVIEMINKSQKEIKIIQPYHYPITRFDKTMRKAIQRNVKGEIITSGKRDQPVFQKMYNYILYKRLISKGIHVYETKQRLLHSKIYMTDGKFLNFGSMNNDRWSWNINNEVNLMLEDPRQYECMNLYFQQMVQRSRPVTKNTTLSASRAASITFWQNFLYLTEILMSKNPPEQSYIPHDNLDNQQEEPITTK